jgi:CBS domain-containing protein
MNVAAILKATGSDVFTTTPDTTLMEVVRLLRERRIGGVIVTDSKGGIAGIISERDIVRMLAENGPVILNMPVSQGMTKKVICCRRADTVDHVMAEMTAGRFRHLPVIEDGQLAGLISIGDVVKFKIAEAEMEAAAMRDYIATG